MSASLVPSAPRSLITRAVASSICSRRSSTRAPASELERVRRIGRVPSAHRRGRIPAPSAPILLAPSVIWSAGRLCKKIRDGIEDDLGRHGSVGRVGIFLGGMADRRLRHLERKPSRWGRTRRRTSCRARHPRAFACMTTPVAAAAPSRARTIASSIGVTGARCRSWYSARSPRLAAVLSANV